MLHVTPFFKPMPHSCVFCQQNCFSVGARFIRDSYHFTDDWELIDLAVHISGVKTATCSYLFGSQLFHLSQSHERDQGFFASLHGDEISFPLCLGSLLSTCSQEGHFVGCRILLTQTIWIKQPNPPEVQNDYSVPLQLDVTHRCYTAQ